MAILRKVKDVLKGAGFTTKELDQLESVGSRDKKKVGGFIISRKFNNIDPSSRQDIVWDLFEEKLTPVDRARILAILTVTPDEFRDYGEGAASVEVKSAKVKIKKTKKRAN